MNKFRKINCQLKQVESMNLLLKSDSKYDKYTITYDYDKALDYAFDFDNWFNVKQKAFNDSINIYEKPTKKQNKLRNNFDNIRHSVEKALSNAYISIDCDQLFQEITEDITLCLQSIYISKKRKISKFFQDMFEAYLNGLWPCGYDGVYPNGRLIVYQNKDK